MSDRSVPTILERLQAIQAQLQAAGPVSTHDEAFAMLTRIVNEYEDQYSGIPYDPEAARTVRDGRIYPPEPDSEKSSAVPGTRRYRTRAIMSTSVTTARSPSRTSRRGSSSFRNPEPTAKR